MSKMGYGGVIADINIMHLYMMVDVVREFDRSFDFRTFPNRSTFEPSASIQKSNDPSPE